MSGKATRPQIAQIHGCAVFAPWPILPVVFALIALEKNIRFRSGSVK
jgi:hypothetical protein